MTTPYGTSGKVRVVKTLGAGEALGYCNPVVGMPTQHGYITALSGVPPFPYGQGSFCVVGSGLGRHDKADWGPGTPSGWFRIPTSQLEVASGDAAAIGSWPSGQDCVVLGHKAVFASGVPLSPTPRVFTFVVGGAAQTGVFAR